MHTLTPGEWYLRFTCTRCQAKQVMFPDLSKGKAAILAIYQVTCANCGHRDSYDSDHIERYHHPENAEMVLAE